MSDIIAKKVFSRLSELQTLVISTFTYSFPLYLNIGEVATMVPSTLANMSLFPHVCFTSAIKNIIKHILFLRYISHTYLICFS